MKRFFAILAAVLLAVTASAQNQILGNAIIQNTVRFTGDITPPTLTADVNDYAPTAFASNIVLRLSSDATRNITGIAGGTEGRWIWLWNVGSQAIVLKSQSASSLNANRFALANDYNLAAGASVQLIYDFTDLKWRAGGSADSGTVSSVSVTTANGVSGTVANATTTPAISLTLGAITPTSVAASGTVTGSNLSGTNTGDAVSQPLDADLTSIAGNATGGFLTRTAANTYTARTLTGTAGQITVTNGDGVGGAPTISLPSTITQTTAFPGLNISGAAATNRDLTFQSAGIARWVVRADNTAESGANAGSIFTVRAFDDAGTAIDNPLYILRAAGGGVNIQRPLAVNSTTASTSTTTGSGIFGGGIGVAGSQFLGGNLTFGTSGSILNGTTGSIGLAATGTNQNITLAPSGNGVLYTQARFYVGTTSGPADGHIVVKNGVNDPSITMLGRSSDGTSSLRFYSNDAATQLAYIQYLGALGLYLGTGTDRPIRFLVNTSEKARFAITSGNLLLGTATDSSNGRLQLATHTTSAGGIAFGTDTLLYRPAASSLFVGDNTGTYGLTFTASANPVRLTTLGGGSSLALRVNAAGSDQFSLTGTALTLGTSTPLSVTNTTASTSTTTGALTVAGGVGVAGALWSGGDNYITRSAGTSGVVQFGIYNGSETGTATTLLQAVGRAGTNAFGEVGAGGSGDRTNIIAFTSGDSRIGTTNAFALKLYTNSISRLSVGASTGDVALTSATEATTAGAGSVTTAGGIYATKRVVTATSFVHGVQTFTGAGAASSTTGVSAITSSGAAQAISLADGVEGQQKTIIHKADGGSIVITPTTKTGFSSVTLEDAGESVTMIFLSTTGWNIIGNNGATITP